jgi:peptide/nickel transport system ATP-binding protein
LATPNHPYTQALLAASGRLEAKRRAAIPVKGEMPSPRSPPPGCQFHPRCPYVMPRCKEAPPPLESIAPGRLAACYLNKTGA